jgi:hypothetical protein
VRARIETACLALAAIAASLYPLSRASTPADYATDGGPAIGRLIHGHLGAALDHQPAMGPFSIFLRAPFAWLVRGDILDEYRAGALACLLVAVAVGVYLARRTRNEGRPLLLALTVALLAVVNPASYHAIVVGHPEEILGAALCVAAVVAASEGRSALVTGTLLGLAVATKQWGVLAIGPVLLAAPRQRVRTGVLAVGIAVLLTAPLALGNPHGFATTTQRAADATIGLQPDTVWYPFAEVRHVRIFDGVSPQVIEKRYLAHSIAGKAKPLIVLLGVLLPLAYWWRRRRPRAEDAFVLLALLFALRGALDPLSVGYYHAPLLLALIAYEALYRRGPPLLSMVGGLVIWYLIDEVVWVSEPLKVTAIYLGWMVPLLAYLGLRLYAPSVISDFGKWLSTSLPPSVTVTRSSIRTPNAPGR